MANSVGKHPRAFLSYSYDGPEHRAWVLNLAARLRWHGVEAILDKWELEPGDQLPEFMEKAVRENDFVLIICTPRYRERSDRRIGGVGYEDTIMTGEVLTAGNPRKFIPVLRSGDWQEAAPSWLTGKVYVDLSGEPYSEENYQELLQSLLGTRPKPPTVRPAAAIDPAAPTPRKGTEQEAQPAAVLRSVSPADSESRTSELRDRMARLESELYRGKDAARLTDRVGPCLKYDKSSNQVQLLILNPGPQADFYGVFYISGEVSKSRSSRLNCKWSHTDTIRTKLARGETGEIFLAELKWDNSRTMSTATWEIYATSDSGARTIKAAQSSMAIPQVHRSSDILLSGQVFADPDLPDGPIPFRVVLTAFGPKLQEE